MDGPNLNPQNGGSKPPTPKGPMAFDEKEWANLTVLVKRGQTPRGSKMDGDKLAEICQELKQKYGIVTNSNGLILYRNKIKSSNRHPCPFN